MKNSSSLRVHYILFSSRANGPGKRTVIWLQGCYLRCPSCFNPDLQDFSGGHEMTVKALAKKLITHAKKMDGLTISGGEPLEQIRALVMFLSIIKTKTKLSVLLFSGKTLSQILALERGPQLLSLVDVLVDGPYDEKMANPEGVWPSSSNQNLVFLTSRYSKQDFINLPWQEIFIETSGNIIQTGLSRIYPARPVTS